MATIVVDGTDPSIQYVRTGNRDWFDLPVIGPFLNPAGNYGQPYNNTVHSLQSSGSLSFTFQGPSITAYGSNTFQTFGNAVHPSYSCSINETGLLPVDPWTISGLNNQVLCSADSLPPGRHTLWIIVTTVDQTFYFDRLEYTPLPRASLTGKTLRIEETDPSVKYHGDGWRELKETAWGTNTNGSYVEVSFSGTRLTWYGMVQAEDASLPAGLGIFQIDGGVEITSALMPILDVTPSNSDYLYQIFFQTDQLSPGEHTLRATYNGNGSATPLTLDFLVVEQGSGGPPSTTGTPSDPSTTPTTNAPTSGRNPKLRVGAIVGIVVSTLALFMGLSIALFVFRRRRRRQQTPAASEGRSEERPTSTIEPFPRPPTTSTNPELPTVTPIGKRPVRVACDVAPYTPASSSRPSEKRAISSVGFDPSISNLARSTAGPSSTDLGSSSPEDPAQGRLEASAHEPVSTSDAVHHPATVIQHEDSGLRIPGGPSVPVVELPPQYTPT